jgi:hypothetical protein
MGWDYVCELRPLRGPFFIPQMIYEYGKPRWNNIHTRKSKNSEKNCTIATLSTNSTWSDPARTRDFMVRGQRLTVWAKARPFVVSQRNNVHPLQPIFRCVRPTRTTARVHATGTRGDLLACGYRQFYQYWREPLEPWLRLTALLWLELGLGLGLVKPSTFTEAHETTSEKREAPHESILYFYWHKAGP